jgi:hypothetical protein
MAGAAMTMPLVHPQLCGGRPEESIERAAKLLVDLAKRELNVELTEKQIVDLFATSWRTLAAAAHTIHGGLLEVRDERANEQARLEEIDLQRRRRQMRLENEG